jgi:hypothetical protein
MTAATVARAERTEQTRRGVLTPEQFAAMTAVLHLEQRKPGFTRQMASNDIVAASDDVDRKMVAVTKRLLDKKVMAGINREDNAIKAYLETRAAFCTMLARGMWAIPLGMVEEVDGEIDGYKARRAALVRVLIEEKYIPEKAAAERRLGRHYRETEYPLPEELAAQFSVRTNWISFNVPSALQAANAEIYQRESARLTRELVSASEEIRGALREAFAGYVEAMADRLGTDAATGKPNRFQDSTVLKMKDFLSTFAARDLTGDADLAALVAKANDLLAGKAPEAVRSDTATRARVLTAMQEIKGSLAGMNVVPPKARKLRGDGEV